MTVRQNASHEAWPVATEYECTAKSLGRQSKFHGLAKKQDKTQREVDKAEMLIRLTR